MKPKKLPFKDFKKIYSKVPRLCVDLVITDAGGVILTKRDIEPLRGYWHLPGGTVLLGESLSDTTKRVAKEETGIDVEIEKLIGYIEYPYRDPIGQTITIVFLCKTVSGKIRGSSQGKEIKFFNEIPNKIVPEQERFLRVNKILG